MTTKTIVEPQPQNIVRPNTRILTRTRAVIVGHEPSMCRMIRDALTAADVEFVEQVHREDAAIRLQMEKFDLILVDVNAPSEEEDQLVRKIRDSGFNQKTLILMLSDDLRRDALSKAFRAGVSFFVFKPIDRTHVIRLIRVVQGAIEQEKRRFRRIPVQTRVQVKNGSSQAEGTTIDVSLNGALVDVSRTFPPGSMVEVNLSIVSGGKPVIGKGTIARIVNGKYMGICFDHLPMAESGRLQEYLLLLLAQ